MTHDLAKRTHAAHCTKHRRRTCWALLTALSVAAIATGCSIFDSSDEETRLIFLTQLDSVNTGVAIEPIKVAFADAKGRVLNTASGTISISLDSNRFISGTLSGTLTAVATNGVATFTDLSIDKPWSYAGPCCGYSLHATAAGFAPVSSANFYAYPSEANQLKIVRQPGNGAVGSVMYVGVAIVDAAGNALRNSAASVTLSLTANPGGAALSGQLTQLTIYGGTDFLVTIDKPGTGYTLTATADGLSSATTAPFDVLPKP